MTKLGNGRIVSDSGTYYAWTGTVRRRRKWLPWSWRTERVWLTNWTSTCFYTHREAVALVRYAEALEETGPLTTLTDDQLDALADYWSEVLDVCVEAIHEELRQGHVIDLTAVNAA
ncbi:hypothetical protein F0L68_39710 [Solihabitans fulvus]|uniref:Uncharacterized protein n=1 Tax=Solihabitans fulvus TaxID=1892852 RepID=A0A5B2WEN7_9PSEU|nr:hypothetical protein [Solihabitans fulvus]KAA2248679.1 hypothetical protein F0L68_39710 [Solihabitans fulvus]